MILCHRFLVFSSICQVRLRKDCSPLDQTTLGLFKPPESAASLNTVGDKELIASPDSTCCKPETDRDMDLLRETDRETERGPGKKDGRKE